MTEAQCLGVLFLAALLLAWLVEWLRGQGVDL
jgi:hypothetical protein